MADHPIDAQIERAEAEIKLLKLERKLVDAKEKGPAPAKLKEEVRAARQHFRENFRDRVTVSPASLGADADVNNAKGA